MPQRVLGWREVTGGWSGFAGEGRGQNLCASDFHSSADGGDRAPKETGVRKGSGVQYGNGVLFIFSIDAEINEDNFSQTKDCKMAFFITG